MAAKKTKKSSLETEIRDLLNEIVLKLKEVDDNIDIENYNEDTGAPILRDIKLDKNGEEMYDDNYEPIYEDSRKDFFLVAAKIFAKDLVGADEDDAVSMLEHYYTSTC